jgi:predicted mannosyl-3-phosphoglycerate phosphatase (HAD superfamily)
MNDANSGSRDPLIAEIVKKARKLGYNAYYGFPPPEEMERLRKQRESLEVERWRRREEFEKQKLARLKERALEAIERSTREHVR